MMGFRAAAGNVTFAYEFLLSICSHYTCYLHELLLFIFSHMYICLLLFIEESYAIY